MSDLTPTITQTNIESLRGEIQKKINGPYFANSTTVNKVITDMDHHPYTRWFRGVYYYPEPVIMEREAGWRPIQNVCYTVNIPNRGEEPHRACPNSTFEPGLINI